MGSLTGRLNNGFICASVGRGLLAPSSFFPARSRLPPSLPPVCLVPRRVEEPERRDGSGEVGQPERNKTWSGMADKSPTLLLKLFAAGFYGLSSFLIVVVNKSVLTNYR